MVEAKQAPKAKQAGAAKGAAKGALRDTDPRLVRHIARAISGLAKPEWAALGKDGQKDHVEAAKRVVKAQKRYAAVSAKQAAGEPAADA